MNPYQELRQRINKAAELLSLPDTTDLGDALWDAGLKAIPFDGDDQRHWNLVVDGKIAKRGLDTEEIAEEFALAAMRHTTPDMAIMPCGPMEKLSAHVLGDPMPGIIADAIASAGDQPAEAGGE